MSRLAKLRGDQIGARECEAVAWWLRHLAHKGLEIGTRGVIPLSICPHLDAVLVAPTIRLPTSPVGIFQRDGLKVDKLEGHDALTCLPLPLMRGIGRSNPHTVMVGSAKFGYHRRVGCSVAWHGKHTALALAKVVRSTVWSWQH